LWRGMKKPNDHAEPTKVERYEKKVFYLCLRIMIVCIYNNYLRDNAY